MGCFNQLVKLLIYLLVKYLCIYVCRNGISGEIINNSIKGNIANKINIKDDFIVVDLFN